MKSWKVKYKIKSYLDFYNKFEIDEFLFLKEQLEGNCAIGTIRAESREEATEICTVKLEKILKGMKFVLNYKFEFELCQIKEEIAEGTDVYKVSLLCSKNSIFVPGVLLDKEIKELQDHLREIEYSDKIASIAYESYLRAVEVREWSNEAFINYFKGIEVISNEYLEKGKIEKQKETQIELDSLLDKLKKLLNNEEINKEKVKGICTKIHSLGFIELRKRINLALQDLCLEEYINQVDKLVRIRNSIAAHGSSKQNIASEDMVLCRELVQKMITNRLKKNNSKE